MFPPRAPSSRSGRPLRPAHVGAQRAAVFFGDPDFRQSRTETSGRRRATRSRPGRLTLSAAVAEDRIAARADDSERCFDLGHPPGRDRRRVRIDAHVSPGRVRPRRIRPGGIAPGGVAPRGACPCGGRPRRVAPGGVAPGGVAPGGVAPGGVAPAPRRSTPRRSRRRSPGLRTARRRLSKTVEPLESVVRNWSRPAFGFGGLCTCVPRRHSARRRRASRSARPASRPRRPSARP